MASYIECIQSKISELVEQNDDHNHSYFMSFKIFFCCRYTLIWQRTKQLIWSLLTTVCLSFNHHPLYTFHLFIVESLREADEIILWIVHRCCYHWWDHMLKRFLMKKSYLMKILIIKIILVLRDLKWCFCTRDNHSLMKQIHV